MIEVLASTPYMMNTMLGGMIGPTIEEAAVTRAPRRAAGPSRLTIQRNETKPVASSTATAPSMTVQIMR